MKLSDKLRKITNKIDNDDDHLIEQATNLINKIVPDAFYKIPDPIKLDLFMAARNGQHEYLISCNDFNLAVTGRIEYIDEEIFFKYLTIFDQAKHNPLFKVKRNHGHDYLEWNYQGNICAIELNELNTLKMTIKFGFKNQIELLKSEGFEVEPNFENKKIIVKW